MARPLRCWPVSPLAALSSRALRAAGRSVLWRDGSAMSIESECKQQVLLSARSGAVGSVFCRRHSVAPPATDHPPPSVTAAAPRQEQRFLVMTASVSSDPYRPAAAPFACSSRVRARRSGVSHVAARRRTRGGTVRPCTHSHRQDGCAPGHHLLVYADNNKDAPQQSQTHCLARRWVAAVRRRAPRSGRPRSWGFMRGRRCRSGHAAKREMQWAAGW